jgi:hypothetical protein
MHKKHTPKPIDTRESAGLPTRGLASSGARARTLPTAAAMQAALMSSLLVSAVACSGVVATSDGDSIHSDTTRRPAVSATVGLGTNATNVIATVNAPTTSATTVGIATPIDPKPHLVKGEMAIVVPTGSVTAPIVAGSAAPAPTPIPKPLGGKPAMVKPPSATGTAAATGTPCSPPKTPETT